MGVRSTKLKGAKRPRMQVQSTKPEGAKLPKMRMQSAKIEVCLCGEGCVLLVFTWCYFHFLRTSANRNQYQSVYDEHHYWFYPAYKRWATGATVRWCSKSDQRCYPLWAAAHHYVGGTCRKCPQHYCSHIPGCQRGIKIWLTVCKLFYTSTKSWRGYIFITVCLCVCVCVCVSLSVSLQNSRQTNAPI